MNSRSLLFWVLTLLCLNFICLLTLGQTSITQLSSHDYNVPTAGGASNGSGGGCIGVGVDHFTGKLQLNMPLGNAGDAFTNVALSYSTGGFKPNSPSSFMGMGWNLQCGGAITRQMRGIPDEVLKTWKNDLHEDLPEKTANAFLNQYRIENFNPLDPYKKLDGSYWEPGEHRNLEMMANNQYDTQRDIFTISAPGISATFILDKPTDDNSRPTIKFIGNSNLEVVPNWSGSSNPEVRGLSSFTVKTMDGSTYFFTLPQIVSSRVESKRSGVQLKKFQGITFEEENIAAADAEKTIKNDPYVGAWILEKIQAGNGDVFTYAFNTGHTLVKSYSANRIIYAGPDFIFGDKDDFKGIIPKDVTTEYIFIQDYTTYIPSRITSPIGEVQFIYQQAQNPQGPDKLLQSIIFRNLGHFSSKVEFTYNYLSPSGNTGSSPVLGISRAVLASIENFDKFGMSPGPIQFMVYNGDLPGKGYPLFNDERLDFWGYFNGRNILPGLEKFDDTNRKNWGQPNANYAKVGCINKIIFPNFVENEIIYESNSSCENLFGLGYISVFSGGVRVKEIVSKSPISGILPKSRSYWYGTSEVTFSQNENDQCWKGGTPFFSQQWYFPGNPELDITFAKKYQIGFLNLDKPIVSTGIEYSADRFLINFDLIQTSPIYDLEDDLGRGVVYTRVKEIKEDKSFSFFEFGKPETVYANDCKTRLVSGFRPTIPLSNSVHLLLKFTTEVGINFILNYFSNESKLYDHNLTIPQFPNSYPSIFRNFQVNSKRNRLVKRMDIYRPGGQVIEVRNFNIAGQEISKTLNSYQFTEIFNFKGVQVSGLVNFNTLNVSGIFYNSVNTYTRNNYLGDEYPKRAVLHGLGNLFAYSSFTERVGVHQLVSSKTTVYDHKFNPPLGVVTEQQSEIINDASNPRLHGKVRSTYIKKYGENNLAGTPTIVEEFSLFRYPSDFLSEEDRQLLKNNVFKNSQYFNGGNCDRQTLAFSYLVNGVQDEAPMEKFSYAKKQGQNWYLTNISTTIPYAWGNLQFPLIGSKFELNYPISQKMVKSAGHLPESNLFSPLDWSYASGFLLDPKFEKKSEILEINKNGMPLTSAPIFKDNGSEKILGEFNSIILGYKNTVPIAEIGMAKASECAYTSFEMPIVNHEDENGWRLYDSNPGQTTSIVNEAFCGGKAAKVDFSFGPTINIPFDMANPKDYVFEAWVKKANPSSPEASICNLGGYICTATDPNGAPWGARGASSPNFTLTEQWQKIRLEVPSSGYGGLTGQNFVLRFYSISNRANGASAGQGFLIDDCRIYPKEAVMKNQTVDLVTGNSYNIDAKGRMIQNVNEKGMAVKKGIEGNLLEMNVLNFSK